MKIYCYCKNCKKRLLYSHYQNERALRQDIGCNLTKEIRCAFCDGKHVYEKSSAFYKNNFFRVLVIVTVGIVIPGIFGLTILNFKLSTTNLYKILGASFACFGLIYTSLFQMIDSKKRRVKNILYLDTIKDYSKPN